MGAWAVAAPGGVWQRAVRVLLLLVLKSHHHQAAAALAALNKTDFPHIFRKNDKFHEI